MSLRQSSTSSTLDALSHEQKNSPHGESEVPRERSTKRVSSFLRFRYPRGAAVYFTLDARCLFITVREEHSTSRAQLASRFGAVIGHRHDGSRSSCDTESPPSTNTSTSSAPLVGSGRSQPHRASDEDLTERGCLSTTTAERGIVRCWEKFCCAALVFGTEMKSTVAVALRTRRSSPCRTRVLHDHSR